MRNCFAKSRISAEDQASAQNDLGDPFVELIINMEKSKSLDVIPEELTPEKYADFDDTVAATEPVLSDESILAMVRDDEESIEVEDDEEEGDDTNKVLEKPTAMQLRSAIETLLDFSLIMQSEEIQRGTLKISTLIEIEVSKIKNYFA